MFLNENSVPLNIKIVFLGEDLLTYDFDRDDQNRILVFDQRLI